MDNFRANNRTGTIDALDHINTIALHCREIELYKKTINIIAHVELHFKIYSKALNAFTKLRDASQESLDYVTKCFAYFQMGKCYQLLKEFQKAVICFKKQLQLAWFNNSIEMEMKAYDNLAIQYFYLGELDRSKYYNDRIYRGKFESNFSIVKRMS